ncbi:MAG: DUF1223 domain-containing protein [Proteobacteria bacterium]|nr:DUF1223 domain-containing protein [Pseudomonadota bacterium]
MSPFRPLARALAALVLAVSPALLAPAATAAELAVVELFTSQGCSSCPPADRYLAELAGRPDVLALSLHVNYWDYIGWKDTFASDATTQRQRDYAARFRQRYVYTPQMVVHGIGHDSGLQRESIEGLIAKARAGAGAGARVAIAEAAPGRLSVRVAAGEVAKPADVFVMFFDDRQKVAVERGENAGSVLEYSSVVRDVRRVGAWTGAPLEVEVDMAGAKGENCAVIVQSAGLGPVLGAARLNMPR